MSYSKQTWINNVSSIDAAKMNHIEDELEYLDNKLAIVEKSLKYINVAPSDWNDARTFGIYHVGGTYTNAPVLSNTWGILIVLESRGETWTPTESLGGDSWIWQEYRDTSGNIYRRHAANTSTSWSSWQQDS